MRSLSYIRRQGDQVRVWKSAARSWCPGRASWRSPLKVLGEASGAQLLEFAFTLPFLLVFAVGVSDFGGAYNLKHKLNNAAREGVRFAVAQYSDSGSLSDTSCNGGPCSVQAVRDAVANYLTNANVTACTIGTTPSSAGAFAWQYTSSTTGCGAFLLRIERAYAFNNGTTVVLGSRVTLTYPYTWSFTSLIQLMPGHPPNPVLPATLTTNAIMQNLF